MKKLIKNVKMLRDDHLHFGSVLIDNDIISKVSFSGDEENSSENIDEVIDGKGQFLTCGFIDIQVHFRFPGQTHKEDLESGAKTANKGGFTKVVCMPNTSPVADHPEIIKEMISQAKKIHKLDILPTASVTKGLEGKELTDFKELLEAGASAFTDDGKGIQSDDVFLEALKEAKKYNTLVLDHSEDFKLSNGGHIHLGSVSQKYQIKGIDPMSEACHVERGIKMSRETGARYHVLHMSTIASLEAVKKAKEEGLAVTCEVSPHHLFLCDEDIPLRDDGFGLDSNYKMNPPLRSKKDKQAMVEALIDGYIDAIATDHAPHSEDEKNTTIDQAPFGIIGLETAFPLVYTELVRTNKMTLKRLVDLFTTGPARVFNFEKPEISPGKSADLVLINLEEKFIYKKSEILSKSKNSPFIGREMYGRVKKTFYKGQCVYEEN